MVRAAAIGCGALLIAIAFIAAFSVADTQRGLIAEVVTLLAGLAGTGLLLYGLVPRRPASGRPKGDLPRTRGPAVRTANDLLIGSCGLLLAAVLMAGLAVSGGWLWVALGGLLLVPMMVGCTYLVAAFWRARERQWRIDLKRLIGH